MEAPLLGVQYKFAPAMLLCFCVETPEVPPQSFFTYAKRFGDFPVLELELQEIQNFALSFANAGNIKIAHQLPDHIAYPFPAEPYFAIVYNC